MAQRLRAGNTHCRSVLLELLDEVNQKLNTSLTIVRLDGGYLSGEILSALIQRQLQLIIACRYDWVLSQGVSVNEKLWQQINTRLYDIGKTQMISTCDHQFRVILVEKKQQPLPGSKSRRKLYRYGIGENLAFGLDQKPLRFLPWQANH